MSTKWYWVIHGRLTSERKASTFHRHSSITRPCCSSAQAPSCLSLDALEHSTGSERVDAFGQPAVEVIICMITRDFSVISIDVTGVSLSLSTTTHKSHSRTILRDFSVISMTSFHFIFVSFYLFIHILANFWKIEVGTLEMGCDLDHSDRKAIIARAKPLLF